MIEYHEDRYLHTPRGFELIETAEHLVEVAVKRVDVFAQRLHEGWTYIASTHLEENAQLQLIDLWTRTSVVGTVTPPSEDRPVTRDHVRIDRHRDEPIG